MQKGFLRFFAVMLCCLLCISFVAPVSVLAIEFPIRRPAPDQENDPGDPAAAQNISAKSLIAAQSGFDTVDYLAT